MLVVLLPPMTVVHLQDAVLSEKMIAASQMETSDVAILILSDLIIFAIKVKNFGRDKNEKKTLIHFKI